MKSVRGFTLIELLVAFAIIAVLISVGLAAYFPTRAKARDSARKQDLNSLALVLELYFQKNFKYIEGNGSCSTDTSKFYTDMAPYFTNGKIPVDPSNGDKYCYISVDNGKSYILYAKLENCSDPEVVDPATCQTSAYNYKLAAVEQELASAPPPPPAYIPPTFVTTPQTSSCEVVVDSVLDIYTSIDTCQ